MAQGERLGCADEYTVTIHWRGGQRVFTYLDRVKSVKWSRRRRKVSTATVVVSKGELSQGCRSHLDRVWPWVHEVTIYRDGQPVWQGPVVDRVETLTNGEVTLEAQDCGVWLQHRILRQTRKMVDADLADIARAVVESGLAVQDPNILDHIVVTPTGHMADRSIQSYARMASDELDEVAGEGVDWTFVGRALLLSGPATEDTPTQARLTSQDFLGDVELALAGEEYASLVYAAPQPQEDVWQHLEGVGGVSPYYGLVEYVFQTSHPWNVAEDGSFEPQPDGLSEEETVAALQRAAQSRHAQLSDPPIVLRTPSTGQLSPQAPISMRRLIPGGRVDLTLEEGFSFTVGRPMRLGQVDVTWDADGEKVGVAAVQIGTSAEENSVEEP